jgi:hypothetical protein
MLVSAANGGLTDVDVCVDLMLGLCIIYDRAQFAS